MKIGPVDTEIYCSFAHSKKEKITEGKIYSPVGRSAKRAELEMRGKV